MCGNFQCVARKNDGAAVTWGVANEGGDSSSVALTNVADAMCGTFQCVARKNDGTAVTWGNPDYQDGLSGIDLTNIAAVGMAATGNTDAATATGDPHLQNIHGERFDLMEPGKHILINIPRGVTADNTLFRVEADARRLGGHCTDLYFQDLNVTGSWAEAKQTGGYHYDVSQSAAQTPQWIAFGKVELKVVHGRTDSGLRYLNVYAKHLGRAGFVVGGLLGEDDHEDVSTPGAECMSHVSLQEKRAHMYSHISSAASIAEGTFA